MQIIAIIEDSVGDYCRFAIIGNELWFTWIYKYEATDALAAYKLISEQRWRKVKTYSMCYALKYACDKLPSEYQHLLPKEYTP